MGTTGCRPYISLALVLFAVAQVPPGQQPLRGQDSGPPEADPSACRVCVVAAGVKKVTRTEYQCKRVDYCLPRLPGFCQLWHGGKCDGPECGPPLFRRVLMKRIVTQECPAVQCEVHVKPAPCTPPDRGPAR
jgi:hypothetical protein